MAVSDDETKIGAVLGRMKIKDEEEITEIVIYKRNEVDGKYHLEKARAFEFKEACITFSFRKENTCELLFFTTSEVFAFDYMDEQRDRERIYELDNKLEDQPKFGVFNDDQTKFIVTSSMDILYVDMRQ